ncbi:MAG TPA: type 1 glutamine amidotransferase-like domain-containing protein [Thermoflexia bacterium]|nr:type 1 glutamine amidotransferase-like domain-containing protein [Thermoflexia bacterium]
MTKAGPLRWATGAGWLVLMGGEEVPEASDRLLARADFSRPIAILPTASGSAAWGERLLDEYADLGGPRGYVVPVFTPADAQEEENERLLAEAGLILLEDGDGITLARVLRGTPALYGVAEAFARGATIVGVGAGAAPLGEWVLAVNEGPDPVGEQGWGWIRGGVVIPRFRDAEQEPQLRRVLRRWPGMLGLGIPDGVALALGPDGQVETWGEGNVTVVVAY